MPRDRTGSLELRKGVYYCRLTTRDPITGKTIRPWVCLNTGNEEIARARMRKANADPGKLLAGRDETTPKPKARRFGEYADEWRKSREARGVAQAESEKGWLANHVPREVGEMLLADVRTRALRVVLTALIEKGLARQTIVHVLGTIRRVLIQAHEDELIESVPELPTIPALREVEKQRAILTDAEIAGLWAYQGKGVDLEVAMLLAVARVLGGMRTIDTVVLDWQHFDRVDFAWVIVPRTKTGKPQRLEIPAVLRAPLCAWWIEHGKLAAGPVFPVRRGHRKGEARRTRGVSFAKRLRRALLAAGIDRHELHHETPDTLPVGFHSAARGGFATALADAGVDERASMALTGHADARTHRGYVTRRDAPKRIPEAAIPPLTTGRELPPDLPQHGGGEHGPCDFLGAGHEARTRDPQLGKLNPVERTQRYQRVPGHRADDAPGRSAVRGAESSRIATAVDSGNDPFTATADALATLTGGLVLLGLGAHVGPALALLGVGAGSPMAALEAAEAAGLWPEDGGEA